VAGELILIVEDNERNLKLVRDVLEFAGFRTVAATCGEDAVAVAGDARPDLVLMDVQLPGIDGVTTLGLLRRSPDLVATPVVAVTAFAMKNDQARFLAAGFDGYLEKPISVRDLPLQVRDVLETHRVRVRR
jgi:two-component system, cell cycle response regulator DivK